MMKYYEVELQGKVHGIMNAMHLGLRYVVRPSRVRF